jgi:dipeptidase
MNEYQVAIGETTYGGLEDLCHQAGAIMDYGSLIWTTLQRSKNATEAIHTMASLMDTYGYYSEGESFSIADPNEVWVMEVIGKGDGNKGAVWVAHRIPDGYISGHANQARIRQFPLNDPANCLYSADVISFARSKGLYNGTDADFSFSDTYNPISFMGARGCDGRVWSFFRKHADNMDIYIDYVTGKNMTHRMPLYVKANKLISLNDTMNAMRDHYEGNALDFSTDVGAGVDQLPYRWRPLDWEYNGHMYTNERATATQQTGFTFVAQGRSKIAAGLGGIIWFGVDDAATTVYTPIYTVSTRIPYAYQKGNGDMMTFSFDSAFWVFNMISNWAYTRWDIMYPEILTNIYKYENKYISEIPAIDAYANGLYHSVDLATAKEYLTRYSETTANALVHDMLKYWQFMFCRWMDGNRKDPNPGHQNPIVHNDAFSQAWRARIVTETGDKYLEPPTTNLKSLRTQKLKGM